MDRITHKLDPSKVNVGDLMAFLNYVRVKAINNNGLDLLTTDIAKNNSEIRVKGSDLVESAFSANQYSEEIEVSRSDMVEVLISSPNRPLTVCFIKKNGKERILRGRFLSHEMHFGRSYCQDLELEISDKDDRIREVDHRTLQFLIVDGVKYSVKGK